MGNQLLTVIVNDGKGSQVLHTAKANGIKGGTIYLGVGTVNNRILELLSLTDIRKEIVVMAAESNIISKNIEILDKKFKFEKKNHGICFVTEIKSLYGVKVADSELEHNDDEESERKAMYDLITVIVERGKAEDVVDSATKAGARGATIIHARGSGIHETSTIFAMEIEPEKEVVLILVDESKTEKIVSHLRKDIDVEKPSHGILFVQSVKNAVGMY